MVGDSIEKND